MNLVESKVIRRLLRQKDLIYAVEAIVRMGPNRHVRLRISKADALRMLASIPADELVAMSLSDVVNKQTGELMSSEAWLTIGM